MFDYQQAMNSYQQAMNPVPGTPGQGPLPVAVDMGSDRDIVSSQVLWDEGQAWIQYHRTLPNGLSPEIIEGFRQAHKTGWRAGQEYMFRKVEELRWLRQGI